MSHPIYPVFRIGPVTLSSFLVAVLDRVANWFIYGKLRRIFQ